MKQVSNIRVSRARLLFIGLFFLLLIGGAGASGAPGGIDPASGVAPFAGAPQGVEAQRAHARRVYTIINLGVEDGASAYLNEKGQVAFTSFAFGSNGYFDGDRLHDIGSLGGGYALVRGLNRRGVVVGESLDANGPFGDLRAFAWTAGRGMRALPGVGAIAHAVNDRNQIVGLVPEPGISARALRWDPDGSIRLLGPLPLSLSEARAINGGASVAGFADVAGGELHATIWDAAGRALDLGTLGGNAAFAFLLNKKGEAAGLGDDAGGRPQGFYWSPATGVVRIGASGSGVRFVADLNDRGEIAGNQDGPAGQEAYLWTRAAGVRSLPGAGATYTDVFDLSQRGVMVGRADHRARGRRAVRWDGMANPVDLNTRLYRAPAGLVLSVASAINEAGDIVAHSNAGLVLLRPGTRGTDAPVLGPITGLPDEANVGEETSFKLAFVDNAPSQYHKASAQWSSGCASPHPLVREARGLGEVRFQHRFCAPGFTTLTVRVADSGGRATELRRQVLVNAPGLAALAGRGMLAAEVGGAMRETQALRFAIWAPLEPVRQKDNGGQGPQAHLSLSGPFQFSADRLERAHREGKGVRLEGSGRYNGRPGYRFLVEAGVEAGAARLRVRISRADGGGAESVVYDNAPVAEKADLRGRAANDRTLVVEGGLAIRG